MDRDQKHEILSEYLDSDKKCRDFRDKLTKGALLTRDGRDMYRRFQSGLSMAREKWQKSIGAFIVRSADKKS